MKKKDKVSVKYEKLEVLKRKCEHCGHSQYVLNGEKTVCTWCGNYIYISPLAKFKDKMKSTINKSKREVIE